jgi:hypothetical protein
MKNVELELLNFEPLLCLAHILGGSTSSIEAGKLNREQP